MPPSNVRNTKRNSGRSESVFSRLPTDPFGRPTFSSGDVRAPCGKRRMHKQETHIGMYTEEGNEEIA